MSDTFAELIAADMRLVILRCLNEDPGYDLNESMLQSMLEALGHNVSRDRVLTELAWLAEQGLVTLAWVMKVVVATLTARGADVATGRATVPGVKRPRPGA
jgi:Fe2+ or Zn2+ uptake regulation protein